MKMNSKRLEFINNLGQPLIFNSRGNLTRDFAAWKSRFWKDTIPHYPVKNVHDARLRWLKKVRKNYSPSTSSIDIIPLDIMINIILPMTYPSKEEKGYILEVTRCSQVCRRWWKYFQNNYIWKCIWIDAKTILYYENTLNKLMNEKENHIQSKYWSAIDLAANKCSQIVVNESDIPFDIYWVNKDTSSTRGICKQTTLEGNSRWHCAVTYPNHKWFCIPTKKWLKDNHYDSLGFSWIIDVYNLSNPRHVLNDSSMPDIPVFIQTIQKPNICKSHIQDMDQTHDNYRHQVMKLVISETKFSKSMHLYNRQITHDIHELRSLEKQIQEIKQNIRYKKSKKSMYENSLRIISQ